jgi:hypothetical protein
MNSDVRVSILFVTDLPPFNDTGLVPICLSAVSGPPIVALVLSPLLCGRFGYSDLKGAAGACGGCGQAMGVESTFACNMLKEVELGKKQAKVDSERFGSPMMSGVSHAQRPPRQRLRSSRLLFTNAVDPLGRKTGKPDTEPTVPCLRGS